MTYQNNLFMNNAVIIVRIYEQSRVCVIRITWYDESWS